MQQNFLMSLICSSENNTMTGEFLSTETDWIKSISSSSCVPSSADVGYVLQDSLFLDFTCIFSLTRSLSLLMLVRTLESASSVAYKLGGDPAAVLLTRQPPYSLNPRHLKAQNLLSLNHTTLAEFASVATSQSNKVTRIPNRSRRHQALKTNRIEH